MNTQIKNVKATLSCGCKVVEAGFDTGFTKVVYDNIEYCRKHKAAPDMYEALKTVLSQLKLVSKGTFELPSDAEAIKQAEQSLSKADEVL